ncbi:MAG: bifunctional (p)ppGpp synthetase/guanosine-3',5'-bis(diphosphate) 3'-pyrophosphohydrolase [Acidimicrobiia bacterium]|nr:bifunctional (p)ppGpp synthetase/guanosine-3',5'-bis(diphosphate) 3'-pyrophosphohydrolase [Acidimicrobiia bacterium]
MKATGAAEPLDAAGHEELAPVLAAFREHHPTAPSEMLERAYREARRLHEGQLRKSGDPYISHPVEVARILAEYGLDAETIAAALLHDTVEDTEITLEQLEEAFGTTTARLIDGVTKLDRIKFSNREQAQAATIRKMVVAMARDVRVLLIKLVDRLHNIRTIAPLSREKQERIARETIEVYAPLAHRLGVQEVKHEMEDRCFEILHPLRYAEIQALLSHRAAERDAYLEGIISEIRAMLADQDVKAVVTGRPKHIYSIYRKMVEGGRSFEEIHDLIGIRIVTAEVADCYAALGMVHTRWPPVHGRFKDYIAMPKFNLYQSLHTTVVGKDGKPLEVQIRTVEMHERAERGIAAHWRYKEGAGPEVEALRAITFLAEEYETPEEFLAGLKIDLYQDEVFVLTPAGDVRALPRGATAVDFAYSVHTEVGHRCTGAKVNGRLVPLDRPLESGDIIEVLTSKSESAGPSRDWLAFARTSRAQAKIRQWFTKERRDAAESDGREQVLKLLRREGLGLTASAREELLMGVARDLGYRDTESLYAAVGENNVQAATLVARLVRVLRPPETEDDDIPALAGLKPGSALPPPSGGIIVEGLDDMWTRVARCCSPVPGDPIVGFDTVGRGVSVHRSDCTNIGALGDRPERMVEVQWGQDRGAAFRSRIQVEALDRPRLLRDVTSELADHGLEIVASSSVRGRDRVAVIQFEVELSDRDQLEVGLIALRSIDGVFDAYRLVPGGGRED